MKIKYSSYKPNSCEMCYFWHPTMKKCIQDDCHYIIYEKEKKTTNNAPGPRGNDDAYRSVGVGLYIKNV